MLPFRTEIINSPTQQTIKIYLSDISLCHEVRTHLKDFQDIEIMEIRDSVAQNRECKNITVFRKEGVDINQLRETLDQHLIHYFK